MSLLVRKIDQAKWKQKDLHLTEDVSADAITNCTKTKHNSISVWEVDQEERISDAVLALASQFEHLTTIDIAVLSAEELTHAGLQIKRIPAETPVQGLGEMHRDIVDLTYVSLGVFSRFIVACFRRDGVFRITERMIRELLLEAINGGRLKPSDLQPSVKAKISP